MQHNEAIGIFDSGVGGTSIWRELHELLPYEHTIYLADSKNAPYGYRSPDEIVSLSIKNCELLLQKGCKLIVVACNTATTNAVSVLRAKFEVPIIGIEPAVKPAALSTSTQSIGILATKGTLSSLLFEKTSSEHAKHINTIEVVGEGLVPLIEAGKINSAEMRNLLKKYTAPMIEADIDYLVLGCSHYPYLIPTLKEILPQHVTILDSGKAVAKHTYNVLNSLELLRKEQSEPSLQFFTNTTPETLAFILQDISNTISVEKKDF